MHTGGVTGSCTWNFGCRSKLDEVTIFGSQGTITYSVFDEKPISLKSDKNEQILNIPHPAHVHHPHVINMRKALLEE